MANIKSAAKRAEIAKKRTLRNASVKSALRTALRRFNEALTVANIEEAKNTLLKAIKSLDKAVTKGVLHKNAAARRKSRLTRKFNELANKAS